MSLDPRTPVVGVGQASERLGEPGYHGRSPVDLAADAARAALADAGADQVSVAAAIDTVAGIRQFENSVPGARYSAGPTPTRVPWLGASARTRAQRPLPAR